MRENGVAVPDLGQLKILAARGPDERKRYLDAIEAMYAEELKAGNASARQLLAELAKIYGGRPRSPLAKEFYQRLLPLLPKGDQELFLKEMLQDVKRSIHQHLEESTSWWKRLW
jgi:hypothetical protein